MISSQREEVRPLCEGCGDECDKCEFGVTVSTLCGIRECRRVSTNIEKKKKVQNFQINFRVFRDLVTFAVDQATLGASAAMGWLAAATDAPVAALTRSLASQTCVCHIRAWISVTLTCTIDSRISRSKWKTQLLIARHLGTWQRWNYCCFLLGNLWWSWFLWTIVIENNTIIWKILFDIL